MFQKIQIKRGLKANLPILSPGEFGLCTDTKELYIGTTEGNILIGGGNVTLVVKDYFSGNANITKTYTEDMIGFEIANDGNSDLTFTINGLTIPVKTGESYSNSFAPFKQVLITSTVAYRAAVSTFLNGIAATPPDTTAPNEVTNLSVSNITANSLQLTWTGSTSSDISIYDIYNGTSLLGSVSGTSYNIAGLTASTVYTFWVKARDTSNNRSNGVSINATTTNVIDITAPNNATNLTTSNVTSSGVTLNWTASTSTDTIGYDIYNGATLITTVTGTSYNVTSLTASTSYTFWVKAKDGAGNIASGISVNATTSAIIDTTAPNNVTNLTTSNITTSGVMLSWTASTSTDTAGYDIFNGTTLITTVTGTSYSVTGLTSSTSYTFWVKAKDGVGNVASGTSVNVTTSVSADTTAPNNVTNLTTSNVTSSGVTLSWTASSSGDTTGYDILNGTTLITTVIGTSYNVTGLSSSTSYTFWVKAKDGAGNVASGVSVNITTSAGALPSGTTTVFSDTFTAPDATDLTAHTSDSGGSWVSYPGTDGTMEWRINSNKAQAIQGASIAAYAVYPSPSANGEVSVDVNCRTEIFSSNNYYGGIYVRSSSNTDGVWMRPSADLTKIELFTLTAGSGTFITDAPIATSPVGRTVPLKVIMNGQRMDFYCDGTLVFTWTDTTNQFVNNTKHGIRIRPSGSVDSFDNFQIKV